MIFKTLSQVHEKLYWTGYFFFFLLGLLIFTTQIDHMVTGVIKPDVSRPVFLAYVFGQFALNQVIAWLNVFWSYIKFNNRYLSFVIYLSIFWVWVGGALDILYFMIKGWIPPLCHIWHWILPFWTTWMHGIYTIIWFLGLVILWHKYFKGETEG